MPEIIDYVDENDVVIGHGDRDEVRAAGHRVRVVDVFVFNEKGQMLVQQRHRHTPKGANKLDAAVGGGVTSGETYLQAAIREASEEIGVDVSLSGEGVPYEMSNPKAFGRIFTVKHEGPFKIQEEELEQVVWVDESDLKHLYEKHPYLLHDFFLQSLKVYWSQ